MKTSEYFLGCGIYVSHDDHEITLRFVGGEAEERFVYLDARQTRAFLDWIRSTEAHWAQG